jgi:hypothetical protein
VSATRIFRITAMLAAAGLLGWLFDPLDEIEGGVYAALLLALAPPLLSGLFTQRRLRAGSYIANGIQISFVMAIAIGVGRIGEVDLNPLATGVAVGIASFVGAVIAVSVGFGLFVGWEWLRRR